MMIRLVHYMSSPQWRLDALLYVDDNLYTARDQGGIEEVMFNVWFLQALGVPWAWHKFRGGDRVPWVGLWVSWPDYRLGVVPGESGVGQRLA